jgi:hypothetical protein
MSDNFDIDLDFGKIYEQKVKDIFEGKGGIEVKTERGAWKKTGNIAIEIRYKGNPSGLSTTNADWWVHILSNNGDIDTALMFKVNKLKKKISKLVSRKEAHIVMGGDNNKSEIVLVPINKLSQVT